MKYSDISLVMLNEVEWSQAKSIPENLEAASRVTA